MANTTVRTHVQTQKTVAFEVHAHCSYKGFRWNLFIAVNCLLRSGKVYAKTPFDIQHFIMNLFAYQPGKPDE